MQVRDGRDMNELSYDTKHRGHEWIEKNSRAKSNLRHKVKGIYANFLLKST